MLKAVGLEGVGEKIEYIPSVKLLAVKKHNHNNFRTTVLK